MPHPEGVSIESLFLGASSGQVIVCPLNASFLQGAGTVACGQKVATLPYSLQVFPLSSKGLLKFWVCFHYSYVYTNHPWCKTETGNGHESPKVLRKPKGKDGTVKLFLPKVLKWTLSLPQPLGCVFPIPPSLPWFCDGDISGKFCDGDISERTRLLLFSLTIHTFCLWCL